MNRILSLLLQAVRVPGFRTPLKLLSLLTHFFSKACLCLCVSFASQAQSLDSQLRLKESRIFLLGEIHDNPNGHSLRLDLVMQLIAQREKPVLAMEQFDLESQQTLDLALSSCTEVDCVLAKAATKGWEWRFYKPLVQLALDKKITLLAANLSNVDVRKVMTEGFSSVYSASVIAEYQLSQLPTKLLSAQRKAIQKGHCDMLPAQAIDPMVQGQIARDIGMARVINGLKDQAVILVAGNGHVRKDAGVFQWLSPENQAQTQVHGYVEQAEKRDADWFDHVHVMPSIDREDPCEVFVKKPARK